MDTGPMDTTLFTSEDSSIVTEHDGEEQKPNSQKSPSIKKNIVFSEPSVADSRYSNLNKPLLLSAIVVSLSSINFGWCLGSPNVPSLVIQDCSEGPVSWSNGFPSCIPMGTTLWGLTVGMTPLGAWGGSIYAGKLADRFGRKIMLHIGNVFFIVGALLMCTTTGIAQLIVGRLVAGIACGIAITVVSTYIGEIATIKTRGFLGGFQQLMIIGGVFLSQAAAIGLSTSPRWRILLALTAAIALVQSGLLMLIPESPRFLVAAGKIDDARDALQRLRPNWDIAFELEDTIEILQARAEEISANGTPSLWAVLTGKTPDDLRHLVYCVLFLMLAQQLSGAKGVVIYSTEILTESFHLSDEEVKKIPTIAQLLTLGIGGTGVLAILTGMSILDRLGRRTILIWSSVLTSICSALIVVGSKFDLGPLVASFMFLFMLLFQGGAGFIPYLVASELLPYYALGSISGLAGSINSLTLFTVSILFPIINEAIGPYLFLPFVFTNIITAAFCFFFVPEGKGKTVMSIVDSHSGGLHFVWRKRDTTEQASDA